MPNQEVLDCQPFSELCTGVDLILSTSSMPGKKKGNFAFVPVGQSISFLDFSSSLFKHK